MADLFDNDDEQSPQSLGGQARAKNLTAEERQEIARKAATARWDGKGEILRATHGSIDRPLKIADMEIPCYVLEDGRRVLSLGGMVRSLGMSIGSGGGRQGDRLLQFVTGKNIFPYVSNDLIGRMKGAVQFRAPTGGSAATGYEATILPDLCDAVLEARKAGALRKDQMHIADHSEILIRGLARVGIIALVDEVTGYQEVRDRRALEEILNKFIGDELRKWTKTFPDDYFLQIFRLKGWQLPKIPAARPGVIGLYTNDVVYSRLAPGILEELKKRNPTDGHGHRRSKHFQHLTDDYGHPRLKEHLNDVVILMKAATNWPEFKRLLDRVKPRISAPGELPFNPAPDDERNA
ncbi:P63C domain-containing protein [Rhizobium laguerreae]|uniref:P63C domain-containing protein n=1 Tax=Rhizobium laguerreae TaxID=1076926 RepID=UPI001C923181|nr:P63C domain-containing protein [Rhizobium laguerreae]MBY3222202.1 hypothetical protein [Rhizobium laguerreae]